MSIYRKLFVAMVLASALTIGGFACEEKEGPAEKAGEKIDETVEEAGDKIEEAGDKVEEATD